MAKPHFKDRTIFSKNLVAVQMQKTRVLFDKSIYVGMSILDQSKTLMYDFQCIGIERESGCCTWIRTATFTICGPWTFTEI